VDGRVQRAEADLELLRARQRLLGMKLAEEQRDVDQLEGMTLTALFHTFLSSKNEKLQGERRELLEAKLKFDQCLAAKVNLEEALVILLGELEDKEALEEALGEVVARKEARLLEGGGPKAHRMVELSEAIALSRAALRELREAQVAGDHASESLDHTIDCLSSARNWGQWDMLGGGLAVTALKHSKIDKARRFAHDAQNDLRDFEDELNDINVTVHLAIEIGSFNSFADFFFDGLIFDWMVQGKLLSSLQNVEKVQGRVEQLLKVLDREVAAASRRVSELEAERTALIKEI
jgi:hypothetical protein